MVESFDELKKYRDQVLDQIRHAANAERRSSRYGKADKFIQSALRSSGNTTAADRLRDCKRGQYCGYMYCVDCRKRYAEKMFRRVVGRMNVASVGNIGNDDQIRWVTILDDVVRSDYETVSKAVKAIRRNYINFSRKWTDTWGQGVIELELVDMQRIQNMVGTGDRGERKRSVLLDMCGGEQEWEWRDQWNTARTDYTLLHTHFVMGANSSDWDEIKEDTKKRWNGRYRVKIDRLHQDKSLNENIRKMSSYCFKNRMQYHYDFGGFRWEDEIDDENRFNVVEMNTLFYLYDKLMGSSRTGLLLGWNRK